MHPDDIPYALPRRSPRPVRPRPIAIVVILTLVVAGVSAIVAGRPRSSQAHPAPLPVMTYSYSAANVVPLPTTQPRLRAAAQPVSPGCTTPTTASARLTIAQLCISAPLVPVSWSGDSIDIPQDVATVGLSNSGAAVSARTGTTLLVGHVDDYLQGPGALYRLHEVLPGYLIATVDAAGTVRTWKVIALQVFGKFALPPDLTAAGPQRLLRIVTCGGPIEHLHDSAGRTYATYQDNVVVTATPSR